MAIEDLKTKADLERFIADQLQGLAPATINGLPEALGSRTCEQLAALENLEAPEATAAIPGCSYEVPANMTVLALANFDFEGSAVGYLYLNGEKIQPTANKIGGTVRFVVGLWTPLTLKKDDVLEIRAEGLTLSSKLYAQDTYLTILRVT